MASLALTWLLGGCAAGTVDDPYQRSARITQQLADAERSAADRRRDEPRQPAKVLAYLGIAPGMQVLDLVSGDGYYAEVLALVVGEQGRVYAQNPPWILALRDGANEKAMRARLAGNRLPNVVRWDREFDALGLGEDLLDAALLALAYHDLFYRQNGSDKALLRSVFKVLKPGGVLGIIDHVGVVDGANDALHRIVPAQIESDALAAGFVFSGRSEVLANFQDDHQRSVFDPAMRGRTDRALYRFVKPAGTSSQP
jgi:predicted methyltransferase